jgi:hypothetical protein
MSAAPTLHSSTEEVEQGQGHHLGRLAQIVQRQAPVRLFRVRFRHRARAGAIQHGRDTVLAVQARIGVSLTQAPRSSNLRYQLQCRQGFASDKNSRLRYAGGISSLGQTLTTSQLTLQNRRVN